jgi:hypothetical protein
MFAGRAGKDLSRRGVPFIDRRHRFGFKGLARNRWPPDGSGPAPPNGRGLKVIRPAAGFNCRTMHVD